MELVPQKVQITLQLYPDQVSGKQPKLLTSDGTKILKGFNNNEYLFYLSLNSHQSPIFLRQLNTFLPSFHGKLQLDQVPQLLISSEENKVWLGHLASRYRQRNETNGFIVLQNLTFGYERASVFDIKIGGRNMEGKIHKITKSVSNYFIKLNGCKIWSNEGGKNSVLFSKYFLAKITEFEEMCKYMGLYFAKQKTIQLQIISIMAKRLAGLIEKLRQLRGYRFISASLCLIYDALKPERTDVRLIDFGRVTAESETFVDEQSLRGCESVLSLFESLLSRRQYYESFITPLREVSGGQDPTLIPQSKRVYCSPIQYD